MSRYHPFRDLTPMLKGAEHWCQTCLQEDEGLLGEQPLWTTELLDELDRAYVQNPQEGDESYLEKLKLQLADASPQSMQLMAELNWVLLLFSDNIKPGTKRDLIRELWELRGGYLDDSHPLLSDEVLVGAAHSGTAFNAHRWRELVYLIQIARDFKSLNPAQRQQVLSDPWAFSEWLASVPQQGHRQFRHILRWLVFPDSFERICTNADKTSILSHFDKLPIKRVQAWSDLEVDKTLLEIRQRLESESSDPVDFYEAPWLERWRPSPKSWLMTWNPDYWEWKSFQDDRLRVARGESVTLTWNTISKQPKEGDTAYLMLLGKKSPKGLVARGTVTSKPSEEGHFKQEKAEQGEKSWYVDITLTDLRDPKAESYISQAELEAHTKDGQSWTPRNSGTEIKPMSAKSVAVLWNKLPPVEPAKTTKITSRQEAINIGKPLNQIFFGPPGTGKTHHWRTHLQPKYESRAGNEAKGEWLDEQLANSSWWETIAMALADQESKGAGTTVTDLLIHPFFKAKARVQGKAGSPNLRQVCWGQLQNHTVLESTAVNSARDKRQPPLIFDKQPGSHWVLTGDWEEAGEGLRDQLKKLQQGPQDEETRIKRHLSVTFHQSYSYEDFVEGIRPQTTDGGISYEVRDGLFKAFCNRARQDPDQRYALFVDEINRGNISRIFGELITLIEADKRAWWDEEGRLVDGMEITLPYSGDRFGVPKNLDIYATMNTADRSIALMDAALRRRFRFIELMPEPKQITGHQGDGYIPDGEGSLLNLRELLNAINLRLRYLLHRDQTFGHAYFMEVKDINSLRSAMVYDIIPMLSEYFYDDWQQIRRVLADDTAPAEHQIITRMLLDPGQLFAGADVDLPEKPDFRVKSPEDISPDALRKIYESLDAPG